MLDLPEVTLCCVDTRNHALALRALQRSRAGIRYARSVFFTDELPAGIEIPDGIDVVDAGPIDTREAYSRFVLKSLVDHVATRHLLLVQWDGYVVNPEAWDPAFAECDYIGAKWFWFHDGMNVGNGGFSLRSRKLLEALRDARIQLDDAEDMTIGRSFRPLLEREYGIRYATEALADRFSFEAAYPIGTPFGFHGLFNFCRTVPPAEIAAIAPQVSDDIARSIQFAQLARNCHALGQWAAVAAIARRMLAVHPGHDEAPILLARAEENLEHPPAVGRNDRCPCGSGKRYKQCHGAFGAGGAAHGRPSDPPPLPAVPVRGQDSAPTSSPDAQVAAAISAHQRGERSAAEREYKAVLAVHPDHPIARHYLGVILYERRELDRALPLLQETTELMPQEPEFHNNLGLALAADDRDAEAVDCYKRTLELNPNHAAAWNNMGLSLQAQNDFKPAIDAFRRAIAIDREFARARWNLSLALLDDGQFVEGFREYDWRLAIDDLGKGRHRYAGPAWDGLHAAGRTVLIYAEQGLGDALQFARYATLVADAGASPLIHCAEPLRDLLATVPGVAGAYALSDPLPRYDTHVAMLSLPRIFRTELASVPAQVPYLTARSARRAAMRAMLARQKSSANGALKVGLAWAGNKANPNDRNRSMSLAALAPLLSLPGVAWQSLQLGADADIEQTPGAQSLAPLAPDIPLGDTAALISELDLVIAVDTAVAHLAGALGRPLWVMLPYAPGWRWLLGSDRSPWYPTARLFRQSAPRGWPEVVARVREALAAHIDSTGAR